MLRQRRVFPQKLTRDAMGSIIPSDYLNWVVIRTRRSQPRPNGLRSQAARYGRHHPNQLNLAGFVTSLIIFMPSCSSSINVHLRARAHRTSSSAIRLRSSLVSLSAGIFLQTKSRAAVILAIVLWSNSVNICFGTTLHCAGAFALVRHASGSVGIGCFLISPTLNR
jgi:hypothetical protein